MINSKSNLIAALAAVAAIAGMPAGGGNTMRITNQAAAQTSASAAEKGTPAPTKQQRGNKLGIFGGSLFTVGRTPRRPGPGWTNKHAQRLAKKARNIKRHKSMAR